MSAGRHLRLLITVSAVWLAFWAGGLPDYYRQYPFALMLALDAALLPPFVALVHYILRREARQRMRVALWLGFYFTVPFFVYDYLYCGLYLGHGLGFMRTYWYATAYYIIPWLVCVPIGLRLDARALRQGTRA